MSNSNNSANNPAPNFTYKPGSSKPKKSTIEIIQKKKEGSK